MVAFLPLGRKGMVQEALRPGDTMMLGDQIADINAVTSSNGVTITPAQASAAIISRRGQTFATNDKWPSSTDYLTALTGSGPPVLTPGMSFKKRFINNEAFDWDFGLASATGWVQVITSGLIPANTGFWRDIFFTVQSTIQPSTIPCLGMTIGSNVVNFIPDANGKFPRINTPDSPIQIAVGCGCGVASSFLVSTVTGLIYSNGAVVGVTLAANAALNTGTPSASFYPIITYTQIGKGTST